MSAKKSRTGTKSLSQKRANPAAKPGLRAKSGGSGRSKKDLMGPKENLTGLTRKDLLRLNSLLIALSDIEFEKCYERCKFHQFLTGDVILDADSMGKDVYFVVDGTVQAIDGDQEGFDLISNDVEAGGWFGEISAIDEGGRSATVSALTDVVVASIPRAVFMNLILEHRVVALKVLEDFSSYIRMSASRVKRVSSYTGVQRVYMELMQQAEPDTSGDGTWQITRLVKHKDLAEKASTSLDIVARAISQLIKLGLMKREGGTFRIIDRQRIQQMINQS